MDLAVVNLASGGERVAFARVRLGEGPVARWVLALLEGQDPGTIGAEEFFGYGVDAGTGCFMDPAVSRLLEARLAASEDLADAIIGTMEASRRAACGWASIRPSDEREENVVCFSSGWGDGCYPSFFGLDAEGRPVALVTDFCVLLGPEAPPAKGKTTPQAGAPASATAAPSSSPREPALRRWWRALTGG